MKKHHTQMTSDELNKIEKRISETSIASVQITLYTAHRFQQRFESITLMDVAEVFLKYNIIEFNTNSGDRRVLLRGTKDLKTDKGCFNVCLVYSVRNNRIVTTWLNNASDNHKTLDIDEYTADMEISW